MPKERDRSHQDNKDQEPRSHRSSSHRHRSHKHGDRRRREHRHRQTPYHREKEPRSSTHIYFNASDNSLHTDHVSLASSLNSLMVQNGGMAHILDSCYEMLGRLRKNQIANPGKLPPGSTATSSTNGQRGVNPSNLANVPRSQKTVEKKHKPR